MEETKWKDIWIYSEENVNSVKEKVRKILEEKQDQLIYQDFNSIDLIHPSNHQGISKFFSDYPPEPHHYLLEVGTGLGGTSRFIHTEYNLKIFGFDFLVHQVEASVFINNALNIENEIEHVQGDANSIELPSNTFDLGVIIGVLMYIPGRNCIENIMASIKPGGLVYIEEYYRLKEIEDFDEEEKEIWEEKKMFGTRSKEEMKQELEETGMELIEMSEFGKVWSESAWDRAESYLREEKNTELNPYIFRHRVVISSKILSDMDEYTLEELKLKYPLLDEEIDIESIVFLKPKFLSVFRVIARKRS